MISGQWNGNDGPNVRLLVLGFVSLANFILFTCLFVSLYVCVAQMMLQLWVVGSMLTLRREKASPRIPTVVAPMPSVVLVRD